MSEMVERLTAIIQQAAQDGADSPVDYGDAEIIARAVLQELVKTNGEMFGLLAVEITSGDALDHVAARYKLKREYGEPDAYLRPRVLKAMTKALEE